LNQAALDSGTTVLLPDSVLLVRNQVAEVKAFVRYMSSVARETQEYTPVVREYGETHGERAARLSKIKKQRIATGKLLLKPLQQAKDNLNVSFFARELVSRDGIDILLDALSWVPVPEKDGNVPSAALILDMLLLCLASGEGHSYLHKHRHVLFRVYNLMYSSSSYIINQGLVLLFVLLDKLPGGQGFAALHAMEQRMAESKNLQLYGRVVSLASHPSADVQLHTLTFVNTLVRSAPHELVALSLLQALDQAGMFQTLDLSPHPSGASGSSGSTKQRQHAAVAYQVRMFRQLSAVYQPFAAPAPEHVSKVAVAQAELDHRSNRHAAALAQYLGCVVVVTHPNTAYVTDGQFAFQVLNGASFLVGVSAPPATLDAVLASFLAMDSSGDLDKSPLMSVTAAVSLHGRACELAASAPGKPGPGRWVAAVTDSLYNLPMQQVVQCVKVKQVQL